MCVGCDELLAIKHILLINLLLLIKYYYYYTCSDFIETRESHYTVLACTHF